MPCRVGGEPLRGPRSWLGAGERVLGPALCVASTRFRWRDQQAYGCLAGRPALLRARSWPRSAERRTTPSATCRLRTVGATSRGPARFRRPLRKSAAPLASPRSRRLSSPHAAPCPCPAQSGVCSGAHSSFAASVPGPGPRGLQGADLPAFAACSRLPAAHRPAAQALALFVYLFCGWFTSNFVFSFILCLMVLVVDFWAVKVRPPSPPRQRAPAYAAAAAERDWAPPCGPPLVERGG